MTAEIRSGREYSLSVENLRLNAYLGAVSGWESLVTKSTLHTHPYNELFVCLDGQGCAVTGQGELYLAPGDALLVPAGYPHRMKKPGAGDEIRYVAFNMSRRSTRTAFDLWRQLRPLRYRGAPQLYRAVPEICGQVAAICAEGSAGVIQPLRLVLALAQLAAVPGGDVLRDTEPAAPMPVDRVVALELLLERHFAEDITAADVAAALHIGPRQLARLMQRQYGKSFGAVLTEKRLAAAAHLLRQSALNMEQIAGQTGFGSVAALYRNFKAAYGMAPGQYRQNQSRGADLSCSGEK